MLQSLPEPVDPVLVLKTATTMSVSLQHLKMSARPAARLDASEKLLNFIYVLCFRLSAVC